MERETRNTDEGVIELGSVSDLTHGAGEDVIDQAGLRNNTGISDD